VSSLQFFSSPVSTFFSALLKIQSQKLLSSTSTHTNQKIKKNEQVEIDPPLCKTPNTSITTLANVFQLENDTQIFTMCFEDTFLQITNDCEKWSSSCIEVYEFTNLILGCDFGVLLNQECSISFHQNINKTLLEISKKLSPQPHIPRNILHWVFVSLKSFCDKESDPPLKVISLQIFNHIICSLQPFHHSPHFLAFLGSGIIFLILPNLKWKSGRIPIILRGLSIRSLYNILQSRDISATIYTILPPVLPSVIECLEDESIETRVTVCKIFSILFEHYPQLLANNNTSENFEKGKNIGVVDIIKKLDDHNNLVRIEALHTLQVLLESVQLGKITLDEENVPGSLSSLLSVLLVHLSDPQVNITKEVESVILKASFISRSFVIAFIQSKPPSKTLQNLIETILKSPT